ncbi:MAG: chromosome segregation protein SMC [Clostridiales bacterium]|nr:chromosome segregation protein SMC [Clostridiales bacterium]
MYLKSIEIHGFKSFANKIFLEFHDGITGIVGPNGSGKSNIADAVRWVLGEQSAKQLRGSKMEDIIFSGTQTRKPQGYAYVAITLDNSDHKLPIAYDEVVVARRVYRSGESEYIINGSPCRLRDIQGLFMDTGIGKEGYSLIGQGQIDKILSGKPEDRRELFDEAAGIVKFKKRKHETEKNLEEEKQNLYRITDIISEIEKQIGPLEKQSATAKVYLNLKEELKNLEINQFSKEYDRLHNSKEQIREKLDIIASDFNTSKGALESTKEEYHKLETQLEECDKQIENDKNSYNELKLQKEKAEGDIKLYNEQISSAMQSDQYVQNNIISHEKDIEEKKAEEKKYLDDKFKIDDKISTMDDQLSSASEELEQIKTEIDGLTKSANEYQSSNYDLLNTNSSIKGNIQRFETMIEQNNIRKSQINQKVLKNKSDDNQFMEDIRITEEKLLTLKDDISVLSKDNENIEKSISDSQNIIDQLTAEYNDVQGHYHNEKSRLESLINLTERYEGYGNSIKKVMEQKSKSPGIIGVVADIIKVDKNYETAIETALGGSIQNIVTEDEKTAKTLIEHLKRNKYGRATFLPLTNIGSSNGLYNDNVLKEDGVIGVASDLVKTDPKFQPLIENLLGRIVVIDNINNATDIARKYRYSLRIVTIEGELLTPGGSISGGAYRNASNLLGRRREIEDIKKQVVVLKNKVDLLLADKEEMKQKKNDFRQKLEIAKNHLQEKFLEENTAKMSLDRELAKKAELERVYLELTKELHDIDIETISIQEKLDGLNESLKANQDKNEENYTLIASINQELEEKRSKEVIITDKVASLKLEFSSLEQSNEFILENISRVKKDIYKLYEDINRLREDSLRSSSLVEERKLTIENTKSLIDKYQESILDLEGKIKEQNSIKETITIKHKSFFEKRDQLSSLINDLDKEMFRLNSQMEKIEEQLDGLISYMWEEYEFTYSMSLEQQVNDSMSLSQVRKSIAEHKNQIKNLGDVNVNSIEDYKNTCERYNFLTVQKDDLIKSEEALIQIIEQLDAEMRIQFAEKFKAINEQFDTVFKELFGGGKADLQLTDADDILEAGIHINAQPPGKKLQNMMQLSGGEKSLTAISLLFAILNLKPSPFCLLDEIEAALDDSNVKRFASYLHRLTKETQFIIITHRRGTMAAADILYGITMQEKGVSTLVSVNLIENELDE